jgi:hypothetical protein
VLYELCNVKVIGIRNTQQEMLMLISKYVSQSFLFTPPPSKTARVPYRSTTGRAQGKVLFVVAPKASPD